MKNCNFKRTKYSCYFAYLAISSIFSLPPILFVTFREMYGISYTLLGFLVLVNFCTQLIIDLIFSFFTRHFNVKKVARVMPLLTSLGLFLYALAPALFREHTYIGLLIGTVIFSISSGLGEVIISPIVAALPSDNPKRDMSTLHSLYAYGVVGVVIISTVFLNIFGTQNWMYLTSFFAILPLFSSLLFCISPFPEFDMSRPSKNKGSDNKNLGLALCALCIFLGGASENAMTNWISGYMENSLQIPKEWSDIVGLTLFAILLGVGRTLYAKYGKNISSILLFGMIGATVCYIVVGISQSPALSAFFCVATGFCTSMLWPGTLILMEEKIQSPGIAAYALMAAGGDLGSSIAPQMLGIVVDRVSASQFASQLGEKLSMSEEQIGMRIGMLSAALFPLLGICLLLFIRHYFQKTLNFNIRKHL